ncbi:MAG: sugar phosphate isomerase/epimerase [Clostridia bacterium]|nr:sugar phosphate isomerase/epimerase [Clostridia bacterium]
MENKINAPYEIGKGTSSIPVPDMNDEWFKAYRDAGVKYMEISPAEGDEYKVDFEYLSRLSEKYGVVLWSYHLPFMPFEGLDISKPELADHSVEYISELIRRAGKVGIKIFVIHPSGEPIDDADRPTRMECSKKSLKKLAAVAREYGATIAVENLPRTCLGKNSAEILELVSVDPDLRVCFDTNHLLGESHESFLKNVGGELIVTTHISDYDFVDEKHFMPGEGRIDWQKFLRDLIASGYKGIWLYELGLISGRIIRERPFTLDDYRINFEEICAGKKLTTLKGKFLVPVFLD